MADAASAVVNYFKGNMAFINIMANQLGFGTKEYELIYVLSHL